MYIFRLLIGILLGWFTEGTGGSASIQGQAVQWEEHGWLPLVGPKLEIGTEMRKLSVINKVLAIGVSFQAF